MCAYETGTFKMLMCDEMLAINLRHARGNTHEIMSPFLSGTCNISIGNGNGKKGGKNLTHPSCSKYRDKQWDGEIREDQLEQADRDRILERSKNTSLSDMRRAETIPLPKHIIQGA